MKRLITLLMITLGVNAFAQVTDKEKELRTAHTDTVEGWKVGGIINVGITQTSFSYWAAGGQNAIAVSGLLSLTANYIKGNSAWDNALDVGYGVQQQGNNSIFRKTDDKLDLSTKFGQKMSPHWYFSILGNFKTQMTGAYNYPNDYQKISDIFSPSYTLLAVGFDHKIGDMLSVFIAPATAKYTTVTNQTLADAGAFGVDKAEYDATGAKIKDGKTSRLEFGGYMRIQFKKDLMKNVNYQTKFDLFSNYLHNPGNMDINWDNILSLKVNSFLTTTISTNLIYDDDINIGIDGDRDGIAEKAGPRTQFKEVISVGLSIKF